MQFGSLSMAVSAAKVPKFLILVASLLMSGCAVTLPGQKTAMLDDNVVEYAIAGSGSPVIVLETGIGDDIGIWQNIFSDLGKIATVLAYNRAGYGKSTPAPGNRSGKEIVEELRSLLTALHLDGPLVMVAHDMGTQYAELFARLYPQLVRGLVLIDPHHLSFDQRCRKILDISDCEPPVWRRNLWSYHVRAEYEFIGQTSEQLLATPPLGDIPLITLSHGHGEQNQLWIDLRRQTHRELAAQSSQGKHRLIENSGSHIHRDAPQAVIDAVKEVVAAVRSL